MEHPGVPAVRQNESVNINGLQKFHPIFTDLFIPGILLGPRKVVWIRPGIFHLGAHRLLREGKCVSI